VEELNSPMVNRQFKAIDSITYKPLSITGGVYATSLAGATMWTRDGIAFRISRSPSPSPSPSASSSSMSLGNDVVDDETCGRILANDLRSANHWLRNLMLANTDNASSSSSLMVPPSVIIDYAGW
jgi:hypothetical protein